jgi:ribosomal protein S12
MVLCSILVETAPFGHGSVSAIVGAEARQPWSALRLGMRIRLDVDQDIFYPA